MRFNRFLWELYAESQRGKAALEANRWFTDDFLDDWERTLELAFPDEFEEQYGTRKVSIDVPGLVQETVSRKPLSSLDEANQYYENELLTQGFPVGIADKSGHMETVFLLGEDEDEWYDYVGGISLGLHRAYPDLFLPYHFRTKFIQLEEIHEEFGIPLPPVPGKHSKQARGTYYLAINAAWQEFRQLHGLSPHEMCAFLYDFAGQFTTPVDTSDLPSPSKVWLITGGIGGNGDFEFLDSASQTTTHFWAGNPSIRRGDILIAHCVSPRSYIHSIWRACTNGFIDPFFHYHGTVWISGCVRTTPIPFAELARHPLLSQKSAIKARFQGYSSKTAFTVEEYEAILDMMQEKGQDLSLLPRIPPMQRLPEVDLLDERDVEVKLIEPCLIKLGYQEQDWLRQMPVRMGRGERIYPDYAFGARAKRGEESAKMVLESKYQLSTQREFAEAFYQTKSYALRLQAESMAMAAKEGIWVFPPEKGQFDIKRYVHKSWTELAHADHFHCVLVEIGRDKVLGS